VEVIFLSREKREETQEMIYLGDAYFFN